MEDRYASRTPGEQRVEVTVMFVEGVGADARARVKAPGGPYWVPAALVADGLGVPVDGALPGMRAVAVVGGDGQVARFEPRG